MLFILLRPCGEEMGVTAVLLTARQISRHNMIELIRERGAFDPIYHRETIGMSRTRGRGGWCRHGVCCWVSSGLKKEVRVVLQWSEDSDHCPQHQRSQRAPWFSAVNSALERLRFTIDGAYRTSTTRLRGWRHSSASPLRGVHHPIPCF
jgi:hypothetical protein